MRKEKKYHYIYKTTNILNGRYYYGLHSTDNLEDGYLGSGTYLKRSLNKYGKENFNKEILEFCSSREELKSREKDIVNLQEIAKKECMNLHTGGAMGFQTTHSIETKLKMSKWHTGKILSEETRQKISKAQKGKYVDETIRKKISKSLKLLYENGYTANMTGCHTKESRQKSSDSQKGKPAHNKGMPSAQLTCPHCNKTGGAGGMGKYHFDKCKYKINY